MTVPEIIRHCQRILAAHYGQRFKGVVLYGSTARRRARKGSDIDLLVLLAEPFDYLTELRQIVDLLYPVQLETDRLLSVKPAGVSSYERGSIQLYRNAKREGIRL